ncbi:MAG: hypothetical protein JOZ68_04300 [Acidimicrobiia bacterium]|nr:hypothetical protein [Acidimicrobiia bacterium]MBV8983711.1 hypothetical protein [Acidimicrobiia bacterium]MBV9040196.1 hypothetical protein [Acidimicrobiia bacterium]MBV9284151.1 hypothetical protein [Acidimicrobiia bacterium]
MADAVEHNMEAPYLVTDTRRRGWGVACSCGFRSPLFDTREEAQTAATDHLEVPPPEEPKGYFARRRAKKQQRPDWMERRKG